MRSLLILVILICLNYVDFHSGSRLLFEIPRDLDEKRLLLSAVGSTMVESLTRTKGLLLRSGDDTSLLLSVPELLTTGICTFSDVKAGVWASFLSLICSGLKSVMGEMLG